MIGVAGASRTGNVIAPTIGTHSFQGVKLGSLSEKSKISVEKADYQNPSGGIDIEQNQWLAEIKSKIEQKKSELQSCGRLKEVNKEFVIEPSRSERFFSALKSAIDSLGNLMGRNEQCGLSGFCAASALVRGAIPGLKRLGATEQFSIVGFVFSIAYLLTTSVNMALALRAYARSYETQSEHLAWILNNLDEVQKFSANSEPTAAEAAIFNEFVERVEKVSFLMSIAERKVDSAESAVIRESVAMMPGGISSGLNSFNDLREIFTKFVSSVFSGISGIFQVLGGVIDLKQACTDKEIAYHNIREMKRKISGLKALSVRNAIHSIIENLKEIKGIFKNDLKFSDLRMFKGSMAISAGIAGLIMVGFKIAALAGVVVLSAVAIKLALMSISILTGVIMLVFLGTVAYITYNSIKDVRRSQEEKMVAENYIKKLSPDANDAPLSVMQSNIIENNKYIELHWIAEACLKKNTSVLTKKNAEEILSEVGVKSLHLKALIVEASNKGEEERIEWFKSRIAKYLNISYDLKRKENT